MNQKSSATYNIFFLLIGWRNGTRGADEGKFRRVASESSEKVVEGSDPSFRKSKKVDVVSKS